jgi:hypothetical protein
MPKVRIRLRTVMIVLALLTPLAYLVAIPAWRYYSLSPADRVIVDALEQRHDMPFANGAPLQDVIKHIRSCSIASRPPLGVPIYVEPIALNATPYTLNTPVQISSKGAKLKTSLEEVLKPLGLEYQIKNGLLIITSEKAVKLQQAAEAKQAGR